MNAAITQLKQYLHKTLGLEVAPTRWDGSKRLPIILQNLYIFFEVQVLGARCLLMLDLNEQEQSPAVVSKHRDQVQDKWGGEVVYVRSRITAYNRKRLIDHKMPFVVPGNQMFLPMLGVDLREHFKKLRTEIHRFSPSTQALVIHVLLQGTKESIFTPTDMAECLGYSAMTMTRAFDELESANLGEFFIRGRERCVRFSEPAQDTWTRAQPFLRSPVKKRLHIEPLNTDPPGPRAGLTALAEYTMLAEPTNPVVALTGAEWKSLQQHQRVNEVPVQEPGLLELEIWSYSPNLFVHSNVVDRLSLYLSLKDNRDERIEAALEEMMKGLHW
jgi:hypothetical protein